MSSVELNWFTVMMSLDCDTLLSLDTATLSGFDKDMPASLSTPETQ